jgi:Domain of unknown function (DUF4175)
MTRLPKTPLPSPLFHLTLQRLASVFLFGFAVLCGYLTLSLFEVWTRLPFWVQDGALVGGIVAFYVFARQTLAAPGGSLALRPGVLLFLGVLAVVGFGGLVAGLDFAGSAAKGRVLQGFVVSLRQPPASAEITLTAEPPDYLGLPRQTLFTPADGAVTRHAGTEPVVLPEGTALAIVLGGTKGFAPTIVYRGRTSEAVDAGDGRYTASVSLLESGVLDIRVGPYISLSQPIEVIPDREPAVAFVEEPSHTKRDSIKLRIAMDDDHGLETLALEISRRDPDGFRTETIPLRLLPNGAGKAEATAYVNLLAHRWAGSTVEAAVVGTDALGQEGRTKTVSLRLPQKDFANSAAGVLISIRSALTNNPERKNAQVRRLDALAEEPGVFNGRLALYATLRTTYWKLRSAETQADFDQVNRLLWQMALALEDDGTDEQQAVIGLFDDLGAALTGGGGDPGVDVLAGRLEKQLRFLFDREIGLFSTRTGMAGGVEGSDVPALETFPSLIERLRALHAEGRDGEALAILLQLEGYFEAFALNPETPAQS